MVSVVKPRLTYHVITMVYSNLFCSSSSKMFHFNKGFSEIICEIIFESVKNEAKPVISVNFLL